MVKVLVIVVSFVFAVTPVALAQVKNFAPVTEEMLLNPSADDWLMLSRTYDQQRFSPLNQIDRRNVAQLRMAWARGMGAGITESVPIVYQGVMYVVAPGAVIQALDATSGDLIWEYRRKLPSEGFAATARTKNLAIYEDLIFYTAPDGYLIGLEARTGQVRWENHGDQH